VTFHRKIPDRDDPIRNGGFFPLSVLLNPHPSSPISDPTTQRALLRFLEVVYKQTPAWRNLDGGDTWAVISTKSKASRLPVD
jgi:hypothetical protein